MNSLLTTSVLFRACRFPGSVTALSLFCLVAALPAYADDTDHPVADQDVAHRDNALDPVVVTANLTARTVSDSLTSVTVIDQNMLRQQQPRELGELLRGQPGVDVASNGSFGKNTNVFIRGNSGESTLLLIEGVRIRSATSGNAPWQFLPPQLLERVEIVRGPRASIYGADAVGGVVQAFVPSGYHDRGWVQVGGGSFGAHEYGAGHAGRDGNTRYSVAANHFHTDGTRIRANDNEDKGFYNTSGMARVVQQLDNGAEVGVLGFRTQGNTVFTTGDTDFTKQVGALTGALPMTERWLINLQVSEARDDGVTTSASTGNESFFDTRTRAVRWDNHLFLGRHELIVGSEYFRDEVDSSTAFAEDSRDNTAAYAQLLSQAGRLDTQASLRWDDNEAFGTETTGAFALGLALNARHRLRISRATAFRAPTFNNLYFPASPTFAGNPDLSPETSVSTELGLRADYTQMFWDLAVFHNEVDNLIVNAVGNDGVRRPTNVERARIRGVELGAGGELSGLRWRAAATAMDPRDRDSGNRIQRRAGQAVRLDLDHDIGNAFVGLSAVGQSFRYNDADNQQRLAGYGLVHLRTGVRFAQHWSARLSIENVLDRQYEVVANDVSAGRHAFLTLRYDLR